MMDRNDIDDAVREIGLMIRVAIDATDSMIATGEDEPFSLPRADGEMLSFALFDLEKRVQELKDGRASA